MTSITVNASRTYEVRIGSGLLVQTGALSAPLLSGREAVIVSDSNVWPLYGQTVQDSLERAGFRVDFFVFQAGETSKSTQTLVELLTFLAQTGLTRSDAVFALGGGVTGDMAGLAAALYLRGIPCIQLPTSLLAAVDSSVGGKTAVDLPEGKNLVGTFTQPHLVLCDTDVLNTLPPAVYAEGWAEIIKYGMIRSKALLNVLRNGPAAVDMEWIIAHCVSIKRDVVAADERDNDVRQLLNFGHTIGHAIERCGNYSIYHGEGVAMGMAIMTRACVRMGRCPPECWLVLEALLDQYHLPKTCGIKAEDLLKASGTDKKRRGEIITIILPSELGTCTLHQTNDQELAQVLALGGSIMSKIKINPKQLAGAVTPPSSKSMTHRLIICAALAQGSSTIQNVDVSQDILATLNCIEMMGAEWVRVDARTIQVSGIGGLTDLGGSPHLDCGESGSTLRFLIPVVLAAAGEGTFTGRGRLMERPLQPYFDLFRDKGIDYKLEDGVLTVRGKLEPGEYRLPGNVSSQFLTGLLLALPLLPGESRIVLTTPLESRDYVSMTLEAMGDFGIEVRKEGECLLVAGGQTYGAQSKMVEADWSQAAFWYAANFLGSQVEIRNLNSNSSQGDMRVTEFYWKLARSGEIEVDVSQYPDLVPPLASMAALRRGTCRLVNAARLRLKESDRLAAVTETLNALGARAEEGADSLTIHGMDQLEGGATVDCHNDHRIAMMAAVAATRCRKPVSLLGAECVNKSYPQFWDHYRMLGGNIDVVVSG